MTRRELMAVVAVLLVFGSVFVVGILVGRFGWPAAVPSPPALQCAEPCEAVTSTTVPSTLSLTTVSTRHRATLADVARDWGMGGTLRCYLEGPGDHRAWWLEEGGVLRDVEPQRP